MSQQKEDFSKRINLSKFSLLITIGFFIISSYVAFFHHNYWVFDQDGIFYLRAGEEILAGNGKNVGLPNAPIGGPVIYAALNLLFNDGFFTMKLISVLSGTGMVFISYYIIRNIFNSKIALVGQLFFVFNPWLGIFSIQAANELLPVFFVVMSLYYITKKELKIFDFIMMGLLLGIAFMIRLQVIVVLIAIIIFLTIKNKAISSNFKHILLVISFFIIAASPLFFYNYSTHNVIIDNDSNFYIASHAKYRTQSWMEQLYQSIGKGTLYGIFLDFELFQKNYFYNLFYSIPNNLFYFDTRVNASFIPAIPVISIIPVIGAYIYSSKIKFDKKNTIVVLCSFVFSIFIDFLSGNFFMNVFAVFIIPLVSLGILNIKKIQKNFLPLLILPVVFSIFLAIMPIRSPQHFSLLWITLSTLGAIFFVDVIPKMYYIIRKNRLVSNKQLTYSVKIIIIVLISLILILNFTYSFVTFVIKSSGKSFTDLNEFLKLIKKENLESGGIDAKKVGDFLSKQPKIEDSYVMSSNIFHSYYAGSKWVPASFTEGPQNDTLTNYITRKNWKDWEIYISNVHSIPMDRNNIYNPLPEYLVITPFEYSERAIQQTHKYLNVLTDYNNPEIPENFELVYHSDGGTLVYKIYHNKFSSD